MKTKLLLLFIALSYSYLTSAQEVKIEKASLDTKPKTNPMHGNGFNYISFGAEIGPTLSGSRQIYPLHLALPVKIYLGRQKKGKFIVRTGIHYLPAPSERLSPVIKRAFLTNIPLAIGYRKNLQNWYIEGSLGAVLNSGTIVLNDASRKNHTDTYREINYGLEVGRQIGDFDIGLAAYNTGPIPINLVYMGFKTSYRIKW